MGYREDVSVDRDNLEEEWGRQPALSHHYSEQWAVAVLNRDRAKDKVELARAQADQAVRSDPYSYGFDKKPTESAIESIVTQDKAYRQALDEWHEATYEVNVLAGVKDAMAQKAKALESLTRLWLNLYYTESSGSSVRDEMDKAKGDENRKQNIAALNSRRRDRANEEDGSVVTQDEESSQEEADGN